MWCAVSNSDDLKGIQRCVDASRSYGLCMASCIVLQQAVKRRSYNFVSGVMQLRLASIVFYRIFENQSHTYSSPVQKLPDVQCDPSTLTLIRGYDASAVALGKQSSGRFTQGTGPGGQPPQPAVHCSRLPLVHSLLARLALHPSLAPVCQLCSSLQPPCTAFHAVPLLLCAGRPE